MPSTIDREPSLRGAPTYFRCCIAEAATRKILGRGINTDKAIWADYSHPGWHLAIHIEEYLSDEALEELHALADEPNQQKFKTRLLQFFDQEFPGCMALVPRARRHQFLQGIFTAMEDGRFPIER